MSDRRSKETRQLGRKAKAETLELFDGISEHELNSSKTDISESDCSESDSSESESTESDTSESNTSESDSSESDSSESASSLLNNDDKTVLMEDSSENLETVGAAKVTEDQDCLVCVSEGVSDSFDNKSSLCNNQKSDVEEVKSLTQKLRDWTLKHNVTQDACRKLLYILKPFHSDLHLDFRTLNHAPRVTVKSLQNGSYVHIGLKWGLQKRLLNGGTKILGSQHVGIDCNIDGIRMTRSIATDTWPILCRSLDLKDERPFVVGIFVGCGKPKSLEDYLQAFIIECLQLINSGISMGEAKYEVYIRSFICDTLARQHLKKIIGRSGFNACERCKQKGEYDFKSMCFSIVVHEPRTHAEFLIQRDSDHHLGLSPLLALPIDMITQFILDPFNLILSGVVKRFLRFVLKGTKSGIGMRLTAKQILRVSQRLANLKKYTPREFAGKPRGLNKLDRWKRTQFRFFLLYGGCLVFKGILHDRLYKLFVSLQTAMIILSVDKLAKDEQYFSLSKNLLKHFVAKCSQEGIFQKKFCNANVHLLLHLPDDVKKFGVLSKISAFPFKSRLDQLRRMLWSPANPVQQLVCRLAETNYLYDFCEDDKPITEPKPERPVSGTNEFQVLNFGLFSLSSVHKKDSYFLYQGSVASVTSIQKIADETVVVLANICDTKTDFFTHPYNSSLFGIFNLGNLKWSQKRVVVLASSVSTKYVVLPFQNNFIGIPMLRSF